MTLAVELVMDVASYVYSFQRQASHSHAFYSPLMDYVMSSLLYAVFLSSLFTQSYLTLCLLLLSFSPPIPMKRLTLRAKG